MLTTGAPTQQSCEEDPAMSKSTGPKPRRSPGEGSIYKTSAGLHRGIVTWTDDGGAQHRRYVSGQTRAAVLTKIDDLRRDLRLGVLTPAGGDTVGDFLVDWIERHRAGVAYSTWRTAEMHVRCYLVPSLGRIKLGKLNGADVERALASYLRDGRPLTTSKRGRQTPAPVSAQTARHIRSTLRRALGDAYKAGLTARNAAADATPPRVEHRPVVYLSASDVRRLIDVTRDDAFGPIYAVAATLGLRLGELLGLAWSDVDIAAGSLTVRHSLVLDGKGSWSLAQPKSARSRRSLPLPTVARDALDRQLARQTAASVAAGDLWQGSGLVFTDEIGRSLRQGVVSSAFQRARSAAGLPAVRFHDLRHSMATVLLAEGVPIVTISELLGHAGIAITQAHYLGIVPQLRTEAAAAMDRAMTPRP